MTLNNNERFKRARESAPLSHPDPGVNRHSEGRATLAALALTGRPLLRNTFVWSGTISSSGLVITNVCRDVYQHKSNEYRQGH